VAELDAVEAQPRGAGGTQAHRRLGVEGDALFCGLDDEQRRTAIFELGRDDEELGVGGSRHERLGATKDVAVAVRSDFRLELERIEQRPRLDHRQRCGRRIVTGERGEIGALLVGIAP
jgi:hypothetical protein